MARPLDGVRVVDFSTLLPGPLATLILAEAGAEVVKVERPGRGDELRDYAPRLGAASVGFALLNRGKRSLALDLKDPAALARLQPLLAGAQVLVEQFRPGVMDRLGLGYAAPARAEPADRLLLDLGLRPERAQGRDRGARSELPRGHRAARAGRRPRGPAGDPAGTDRRHRRRRAAGGDQHPAGAAPGGGDRAGLPSRRRDDRQPVRLAVVGAGPARDRADAPARRRALDRRLAALPGLSHRGWPVPRRGALGAALLGRLLRPDRAAGGTARRRARPRGDPQRGRSDHRIRDRGALAGSASPARTAAAPWSRASRRPWPTCTSAAAACSTPTSSRAASRSPRYPLPLAPALRGAPDIRAAPQLGEANALLDGA